MLQNSMYASFEDLIYVQYPYHRLILLMGQRLHLENFLGLIFQILEYFKFNLKKLVLIQELLYLHFPGHPSIYHRLNHCLKQLRVQLHPFHVLLHQLDLSDDNRLRSNKKQILSKTIHQSVCRLLKECCAE